jgi:Cu+-exporting ATPase
MPMKKHIDEKLKCYHCGELCYDTQWCEEKAFCCFGCKTIYEVLNSNNLCEYYQLDESPGTKQKTITDETYHHLDEKDIRSKLLTFDSVDFAKLTLFIPSIHCVSCIWLLENLQKPGKGIFKSEVIFAKKTVTINFNPSVIKVSEIVILISSLGYPPEITLDSVKTKNKIPSNDLILKISLAGFCFGNVMLFSFPEYLGIDKSELGLMRIFSWLNLALSVPTLFYSASDYLYAAFNTFKQKKISIDLPIATGLVALFSRSTYDIITASGPGYLDSFTGLVFFLLIGRWFQGKTYESLAFDRNFTSYFPLAVNVFTSNAWKPIVVNKLIKGDRIKIRNMELIPADCYLQSAIAYIDYSFVTGEARPVKANKNDLIYAGGRLIGPSVELIVNKKTSQSHLTSLWNHDAFKKQEHNKYQKIVDTAAQKFTIIVLILAFATAAYWQIFHPEKMWLTLTSVLMVACPCALALAAPFTFGSILRTLGKNKLYLKNADVIERMACTDAIVFDKTGTVTHGKEPEIFFKGNLDSDELSAIKTLTSYSTHPLSIYITNHIHINHQESVSAYKEIPGKGIEGIVNAHHFKIGSASFVQFHGEIDGNASVVYLMIDNSIRGYFTIKSSIRKNIKSMITQLGVKCVAMLSGDHDADKSQMIELFGEQTKLLFEQSPHDKLYYIKKLQWEEKQVMMIGDGLNDAGALKQSNVGIAITEDTGVFTPACDGILAGDNLQSLDRMISFTKASGPILKIGFAISFFYNAIALSFAITGHLTPLIAAIIMPISSISVVGFSTLAVKITASRLKL